MHLLLHPSAWSDRADDEAENDILAMQVLTCSCYGDFLICCHSQDNEI